MTINDVAKICHEANRSYCETLEDFSQVSWYMAEGWQKESAVNGVVMHLKNPGASAATSHESWMQEKLNAGWLWGEEKDAASKTHPCLVSFEELPKEQQAKGRLFKSIVNGLAQFVTFAS